MTETLSLTREHEGALYQIGLAAIDAEAERRRRDGQTIPPHPDLSDAKLGLSRLCALVCGSSEMPGDEKLLHYYHREVKLGDLRNALRVVGMEAIMKAVGIEVPEVEYKPKPENLDTGSMTPAKAWLLRKYVYPDNEWQDPPGDDRGR